jgi:hypothetical protein
MANIDINEQHASPGAYGRECSADRDYDYGRRCRERLNRQAQPPKLTKRKFAEATTENVRYVFEREFSLLSNITTQKEKHGSKYL